MKRTSLKALLLSVAFAALTAQSALAVETPACTVIGNVATVTYQVGTADQTPESNDPAENEFIVGNKINFTVVSDDAANIPVNQAETDKTLSFTVTNIGNANQTFLMAWSDGSADPHGVLPENMNMLTPGVGTKGTASIVTNVLEPGQNQVVTIIADTPLIPSNNALAAYVMTGTAYKVDGTTIEAEGDSGLNGITSSVGSCQADVVFADSDTDTLSGGARNGKDSDDGAFVVTADQDILTVAKASAVYSDPINGAGAGAKLIPGAVVTYTITLTNSSLTTAASSVGIADTLDTNLTWGNADNSSIFKDASTDCTASGAGYGVVIDGVCTDSSAMWNAGTLTLTGLSVPKNDAVEIKFQVTIN